jgi:hypothetical protein
MKTYSTVAQETFEAADTFFDQSFQVTRIAGDDTAVEADIDPAFASRCFTLDLEVLDCSGRRDSVKWHVDDSGDTTEGRGLGTGPETLPFCSAGLVEMYMGVDQTR